MYVYVYTCKYIYLYVCVYTYFIFIYTYMYMYVYILAIFSLAQITGIGQENYGPNKNTYFKNCQLEVSDLSWPI